MTDEEAIKILETEKGLCCGKKKYEAIDCSISALRDRIARQNPKLLTLDELREMDGEPVWIKFFSRTSKTGKWEGLAIVDTRFESQDFLGDHHLKFIFYGKSWLAYRTKPEPPEREVQV